MTLRLFIFCLLTTLAFSLAGCGGGTDPINRDLDRPKKDKDK